MPEYKTSTPYYVGTVRHASDFVNAIIFNEIPTQEDIILCTENETGRKRTVILDFDGVLIFGISYYANKGFYLTHFHSEEDPFSQEVISLGSHSYESVVEKIISMIKDEIRLRERNLKNLNTVLFRHLLNMSEIENKNANKSSV